MEVKISTAMGAQSTKCYGIFPVNFDGTDVLFCFTDALAGGDRLELTEYVSGKSFPIDLGEPSGETLGLDSPMADDDPYFIRLVRYANRLIDEVLVERDLKRWRMLELIQMNQRKHQANEVDF